MDTKHPMSFKSFRLIERCSSHHPFTSSCNTIDLSSTSSTMYATNHPLITLLILTNHTTLVNAPYQPPTLHVNERSQPYIFPKLFNHAQLKHFPPPILLVFIVGHDHTPNLPPFFQHTLNFHSKSCVTPVGTNLSIEG